MWAETEPAPYSRDLRPQIVEMFKAGHAREAIAKQLGIDLVRVNNLIQSARRSGDIPISRSTRRSRALLADLRAKVLELAAGGMRNKDIAERVGLAPSHVSSIRFKERQRALAEAIP